jgi:hypothetical protein
MECNRLLKPITENDYKDMIEYFHAFVKSFLEYLRE